MQKGVFESYEYEVILPSNANIKENVSDILLSEEQSKVFDGIAKRIEENKPKGILLHGVTGSGKTSVFIKLIDFTLKLKNRQ